MIGVLLAAPEHPQEQDIVAAAGGCGLRIVRRCVDGVDLLAAGAADPVARVVVSAGLPRLSADLVDRLRGVTDRQVIGMIAAEGDVDSFHRIGVTEVMRSGPSAAATLQQLRLAIDDRGQAPGAGVWPTGCWTQDPADGSRAEPASESPAEGRLVAVWGPMGAPGRTTVAIGLAEAIAETGRRVCLVDADTYAPSVALALGVVGEAGGLAVACRHADNGTLTSALLLACARQVRASWLLLCGLPAPERWPDLRTGALERVWTVCREAVDVTVIDVGFCLEDDESAGAWSRRRNAAALTAVAAADHVIAVADGGPAGAARLAAGWPALQGRAAGTPVTVVRNRSGGRDRAWDEAVCACGVTAPVHPVPADPRALEACWSRGRSLGEGARRSRIRSALGGLVAQVVSG